MRCWIEVFKENLWNYEVYRNMMISIYMAITANLRVYYGYLWKFMRLWSLKMISIMIMFMKVYEVWKYSSQTRIVEGMNFLLDPLWSLVVLWAIPIWS